MYYDPCIVKHGKGIGNNVAVAVARERVQYLNAQGQLITESLRDAGVGAGRLLPLRRRHAGTGRGLARGAGGVRRGA